MIGSAAMIFPLFHRSSSSARNPKFEFRNPKQIQNSKFETIRMDSAFSYFGF